MAAALISVIRETLAVPKILLIARYGNSNFDRCAILASLHLALRALRRRCCHSATPAYIIVIKMAAALISVIRETLAVPKILLIARYGNSNFDRCAILASLHLALRALRRRCCHSATPLSAKISLCCFFAECSGFFLGKATKSFSFCERYINTICLKCQ